jgi:hypothetical protein
VIIVVRPDKPIIPADVMGLTAKALSISEISASWDSSENATGYVVTITPDNIESFSKSGRELSAPPFVTNDTSIALSDLVCAEDYTISVRSYFEDTEKQDVVLQYQEGDNAAFVVHTPEPSVEPTLVTATTNGYNSIKISWGNVTASAGAVSYKLLTSTSKDGEYKELYSGDKLDFTNKDLKPSKKYYYQVQTILSIDGKQFGAQSEMASAITKAKPKPKPTVKEPEKATSAPAPPKSKKKTTPKQDEPVLSW